MTRNLSHTSAICSRKKDRHQDNATLQNKMGGCTGGCAPRVAWKGGSTVVVCNHTLKESHKINSVLKNNTKPVTVSALPTKKYTEMKVDSGATLHFYDSYKSALLSTQISTTNPYIDVLIPNGIIMKSICTSKLPIPQLPLGATWEHGFQHLASGSLLSVGQLCDHGYSAIFDKHQVRIYKSAQVAILPRAPSILAGYRNEQHKLWSVRLNPPTHHPPPVSNMQMQ